MEIGKVVEFLKELEVNNNKAWFEAQSMRYKLLRAGFTDLVQDVIYGLGEVDDRVQGVRADKSIFRIHRDVRFSKDKSPYKTTFSAVISPDGKNVQAPLYYLQIDHWGQWMCAVGVYMPELGTATRIRHSIVAHAPQVARILSDSNLQGQFPAGVEGESYKRPPKGFDENTPMLELIKRKSFAMSRSQPVEAGLSSGALADAAVKAFAAAYPWVQFLRESLLEA